MPSVWRVSGGAWFYFRNSYWLLVWAVQYLRLQQALNCNSLEALKLECQGLFCIPSKLWEQTERKQKCRCFFGLTGWSVQRLFYGNALRWMLPTVGLYLCSLNDQSCLIAASPLISQNTAAGVERLSLSFNKYLYTVGHFTISCSA